MFNLFQREIRGDSVEAEVIPWDSKTLGFNVCDLRILGMQNIETFERIWKDFEFWSNQNLIRLISVRVNSYKKKEISFLQSKNFLIMETSCQPRISNLNCFRGSDEISIEEASDRFLPAILNIAETSFDISRFHSDSKVDKHYANLRYVNWIKNRSSTHRLWITRAGDEVVSFFLIEKIGNESYWHLTAVNNKFKGQGLGKKSWVKMLEQESKNGTEEVMTRISTENLKVVNLYSQLGAKFYNPETSLHKHA